MCSLPSRRYLIGYRLYSTEPRQQHSNLSTLSLLDHPTHCNLLCGNASLVCPFILPVRLNLLFDSLLNRMELVRKAKDLDAAFTRDRQTHALRGIVWFVVVTYSVLNSIGGIMTTLRVSVDIAGFILAGNAIMILGFSVVIVAVFLIPSQRWALKLIKSNPNSKSLRQVVRRNYFILFTFGVEFGIVAMVIADQVVNSPESVLPFRYLFMIAGLISTFCLSFFVETYMTRGKTFLDGFRRGWARQVL
jgi:hypothetical protein